MTPNAQIQDIANPERGRVASAHRDWEQAWSALSAADAAQALDANALEDLAMAAFWTSRMDDCLKAWERAHVAHLAAGDHRRAAAAALQIARRHAQRVNVAQTQGWRATAARLLEKYPESPERAQLLNQEAYALIVRGHFKEAKDRATTAYEIGLRCEAKDVQTVALNLQGQVLVRSGEIEAGLRLIDESTALAGAGSLDLYETGLLYCWNIGICRDLADYERAREMTEATTAWSEANATSAFPGICRIHRAEIFRLHGDLVGAEEEARSALQELLPRTLFWAARAHYEIGVIKLRQGRFEEASAAFDKAQELGMEAEPGRALLQLERGRSDLARAGLVRVLDRRPADVLDRAVLLSALMEVDPSAQTTEELESIAATVDRPAFRAMASVARGRLQLTSGDGGAAVASLRDALQLWLGLDAPYEAARTRLLIAEAHRQEGDEAGARLELEIAMRSSQAIGARHELARAEAALRGEQKVSPLHELTARQRDVARLVGEGRSNREIGEALFVSERTAEYHVKQILNRLGLDSRVQIAAWHARNS